MSRLGAMRLLRLVCALLPVILAGLGAQAVAAARVPQGFVGMNLGPYVFALALNPPKQFDRLVAGGVETTRIVFSWADAQPYENWSDIPSGQSAEFQAGVGNVPTKFASTDGAVQLAAEHGLSILPIVIYTPAWESQPHPAADFGLPRSNSTYANYVETLVRRYGPHGTFWSANPQVPYVPIRMWQVWNEPNTSTRWPIQPFANSYVAMLSTARRAIRLVDRNAKVVLAGMPNYSWKDLEKIYRVRGARRLFDVVAIHPYTASPQGVLQILELARAVMKRYGDAHKPLIASEAGGHRRSAILLSTIRSTAPGRGRPRNSQLSCRCSPRIAVSSGCSASTSTHGSTPTPGTHSTSRACCAFAGTRSRRNPPSRRLRARLLRLSNVAGRALGQRAVRPGEARFS